MLVTTALSLLTSAPTVKAQTTNDNPINDLLGTNVFPSSLTNINLTLGADYIKSTRQVGSSRFCRTIFRWARGLVLDSEWG